MRTKKRAFPLQALLALLIIAVGLSLTTCFSEDEEGPAGGGGQSAFLPILTASRQTAPVLRLLQQNLEIAQEKQSLQGPLSHSPPISASFRMELPLTPAPP